MAEQPIRASRFTPWADRSIRAKGLFLIAIPMIPMAVTLTFAHLFRAAGEEASVQATNLRQAQDAAALVLRAGVDAETGVRGYAITEDERFLEPYIEARRSLPAALEELTDVTSSTADVDAAAISRIAQRQLATVEELRKIEQAENTGRPREVLEEASDSKQEERIEARLLGRQKATTDALRFAVADTQTALRRAFRRAMAADATARQSLETALRVGAFAGAAAGLIAMWLAMSGIAKRMRMVEANARALGRGRLLRPLAGSDEIARINSALSAAAVTLDVQERQRQDDLKEVERARRDAESANAAKSEFLSRMSHELRTPLNSILGYTQLMEVRDEDSEQRDNVDQVLHAGRHLLALIDDILDVSRIEARDPHVSIEQIPVAPILSEVVDLVRPLARSRDVTIVLDPIDRGLGVMADPRRLKQILLNLLSNGIKFNVPGGSIHVSLDSDGDELVFRVADTGIGMPEGFIDRLFTPFDRLGAEEAGVEGTGLGLALSLRLAEVMGGRMEVESTYGQGSVFSLVLRRAALHLVDPGPVEPTAVRSIPSQQPKTILYIDDNVANLKLVERILAKRFPCDVVTATEGEAGVDLARVVGPDLILLDLNLPDMNGADVLQRLRTERNLAVVPILVVSADAMPARITELSALGAAGYVTKPFDVEELVAQIAAALESAQEVAS